MAKMSVLEFAEAISDGGDYAAADIEKVIYGYMEWAEKKARAEERERTMFVLSAARAVVADFFALRTVSDGMRGLEMALRALEAMP